jgi:hypothetical protein
MRLHYYGFSVENRRLSPESCPARRRAEAPPAELSSRVSRRSPAANSETTLCGLALPLGSFSALKGVDGRVTPGSQSGAARTPLSPGNSSASSPSPAVRRRPSQRPSERLLQRTRRRARALVAALHSPPRDGRSSERPLEHSPSRDGRSSERPLERGRRDQRSRLQSHKAAPL